MNDYIGLPATFDSHTLVEWAEIVAIVDELHDFSLSEMAGLFASGQKPPTHELELALSLVDERAARAMSVYPFRRAGDRLLFVGTADSAEPVDPTLYTFLKIACLQYAPWVAGKQEGKVGALFDGPACDALVQLQGAGATGIVFGTPARKGRPTQFLEAITWLAEQMGYPDGDKDVNPDSNDGGVDCVVWRPLSDKRTGTPVVLAQASVEYDYLSKAQKAIPVVSWTRWIKFGANPSTAFATAHSVPPSTAWMELNDLASVVLDRMRVLELLHEAGGVAGAAWLAEMSAFVDEQMQLLRTPDVVPDKLPRIRKPKRDRAGPYADPKAR
ncbi:MAG TPA: hypothetical protein VFB78_01380 [Acidimicrobiales bacterium]|nr:hypothetical protein [Acidimicrobiales bacterium]